MVRACIVPDPRPHRSQIETLTRGHNAIAADRRRLLDSFGNGAGGVVLLPLGWQARTIYSTLSSSRHSRRPVEELDATKQ